MRKFWRTQETPQDALQEGDVFINALPQNTACERVDNNQPEGKADRCFVYCAQRTCDAAVNFMIDHEWGLKERCNEVVYLKGGALCMKKEQLEDGEDAEPLAPEAARKPLECGGLWGGREA